MKAAALAVRFGLELCILAVLAALAAELPLPLLLKLLVGLMLCVTVSIVWGTFLAPKRRYEIGVIGRLLLEAVLFVTAGVILGALGDRGLGIALVAVAAADRVVLGVLP